MSNLSVFKWLTGVLAVLCTGVMCIGMVSAVMLSSPDVVKPGEEVSIFIGNIGAGDPFQIDIIGNIKIDAGSFFSFKLNKLNLPLDIANPTLRVYINGLVPDSKLNVSVNQKKYNEGLDLDTADSTGLFNLDIGRSGMPKGTYDVEINGTAAKTQIPVTFSIAGTNTNAEPFAVSTFSISGFSSGIFDVTTYVKNLPPAPFVERKQFTVQDQFIETK